MLLVSRCLRLHKKGLKIACNMPAATTITIASLRCLPVAPDTFSFSAAQLERQRDLLLPLSNISKIIDSQGSFFALFALAAAVLLFQGLAEIMSCFSSGSPSARRISDFEITKDI